MFVPGAVGGCDVQESGHVVLVDCLMDFDVGSVYAEDLPFEVGHQDTMV